MKSILFVCTGNTCRSVIAENMLKRWLNGCQLRLEVRSAGISVTPQTPVPHYILELLKKEGISEIYHKTTPLTEEQIKEASLILVMESFHKQRILDLFPETKDKVYLLKEYVGEKENLDILDPFGGLEEGYETCFSQIKGCITKLVEILKEKMEDRGK
ncbi:MAG: low molecular weight protein arginine phosphatase [bacterium]|nr:low molecular weight protein arginine phosphatase [bacterium]